MSRRIRLSVTETVSYEVVVEVGDDWQGDGSAAEDLWCELDTDIVSAGFIGVDDRDVVWAEVTI